MTVGISREIMDEHGLIFSDEDDDSEKPSGFGRRSGRVNVKC
jgi:hypothetical protein